MAAFAWRAPIAVRSGAAGIVRERAPGFGHASHRGGSAAGDARRHIHKTARRHTASRRDAAAAVDFATRSAVPAARHGDRLHTGLPALAAASKGRGLWISLRRAAFGRAAAYAGPRNFRHTLRSENRFSFRLEARGPFGKLVARGADRLGQRLPLERGVGRITPR
jgi:hypothetical protein